MVELLEDMPAGTLGFRAGGAITADDYRDVVRPALDAKLEAGEKLRVLIIVEKLHEEPKAVWEALKADVEFGIRHRDSWERGAVVSDLEWVRKGSKLAGMLAPGEIKTFRQDELDEAQAWTAG